MPCSEISAEWAAQRIKNLDLATALRHAVLGNGERAARWSRASSSGSSTPASGRA